MNRAGLRQSSDPVAFEFNAPALWQLGDIRRYPPRLIFREQLGRGSPPRVLLEIGIGQLLPGAIEYDKAGF